MGVSDEIPFIRKEFSDAVARRLYPAMKRAGLRRQGKRTWFEQHPGSSWSSWVLLEIMPHHTTRTTMGFTMGTAVWPPGTWEYCRQGVSAWASEATPYVAFNSPIYTTAHAVAPQLWPYEHHRTLRLGEDLDPVMDELLLLLLAALDWGRARCGVDEALTYLTEGSPPHTHYRSPDYRQAIVMLRAAAPGHPRLPELVETFTERWRADPRPITLRDEIAAWRAGAGLPEVELPTKSKT